MLLSVRRLSLLSPLAGVLLLDACASKPADPAGSPAPSTAAAARRPRQDQQLITQDVIQGTQYTNLFDVIQALRGNWLRPKNNAEFGKGDELQVYLDNQRIGGANELKNIAPITVLSVRYYDPVSAAARWGMNHGSGAIYVLTSKK